MIRYQFPPHSIYNVFPDLFPGYQMVALCIGTILQKEEMRISVHKNGWGIRLHYCTFILNCLPIKSRQKVEVNQTTLSSRHGRKLPQ